MNPVDESSQDPADGELAWLVRCLRPIFDGLRQPVTVVDPAGRFVYYNQASGALDGLDPQQVLGMHVLESAPWLSAEQSTLLRCLADGRPSFDTVQAYVGAGGELLQYRHRAIPLHGRGGELVGAMELGEVVADKPASAGEAEGPSIPSGDPGMLQQLRRLDVFAATELPLLIHGETGTGKELFARRAHTLSPRRAGPLISLNCAAIPETLLESTLFGTTRGAFTGAENRKGMFAMAEGGSLFLDEINSMPLALQSKLLRVLQDGSYLPLGSLNAQRADVRLIAASNQAPRQAIAAGRLREDLYYRLNVACLSIPPLRERPGDVELLARLFVRRDAANLNPRITSLGPAALARLRECAWPGNVRQLENVIRRSLLLHVGDEAVLDTLVFADDEDGTPVAEPSSSAAGSLRERLAEQERKLIHEALHEARGNLSLAAARLDIPRTTLLGRLRRLGLPTPRENRSFT
ncbi:sigma-54 interaction domain-containing protein [Pseudomonas citronellolis]|uniref:sigma-54 interaction domain-containing protein n=1 Tax=Pseudomonas citronellolis TaxID=53408 RepID=UPI0023E368C2|nr:sigma 54-interacting transcriptional regulator [Pseudomonas citronellolis]MDF3931726.1 sigma 54-interacting transcriptional regulator [Pseudomonas citronellolis]